VKIAVVGGGVAGVVAAALLDSRHEVTLIEAADRLGGHARPLALEDGRRVDTLFQIFNERSYPLFRRWLARLGLENGSRPMEMSFSIESGGPTFGLNLGWRALLRARSPRLLAEIAVFRPRARAAIARGLDPSLTLADWLGSWSRGFRERFLLPLSAAVWSVPPDELLRFPAAAFLGFLDHHGYLSGNEGRWRTLSGSSGAYLDAFRARFRGCVALSRPIARILRDAGGVELIDAAGTERFDHVVLATHADHALALLAAPSADERAALGAYSYHSSEVAIHSDPRAMPLDRALWACWNVRPRSVTYHLNAVHGFAGKDVFVTLGSLSGMEQVRDRFAVRHPLVTARSLAAQPALRALSSPRTSFCGSYAGQGFHEDAVRSASEAAAALGGDPL
jgi:predicted NAD/FAD-binding protein